MLFICSYAHTTVIRFKHLSIDEGLSDRLIRHIAQDHEGFIWIASDSRLSRFDGYQLKTIKLPLKNAQAEDSSVSALLATKNGNYWVGTKTNGLYLYKNGTFTHHLLSQNTSHLISSNHVLALAEGNNDHLWVATDKGLDRINKAFDVKHHAFHHARISSIEKLNSTTWLIGTNKGLYIFDESLKKFDVYHNNNAPPIDEQVYAIHKDNDNNFWVGTGQGIFLKKAEKKEFIRFKPTEINHRVISITSDNSHLWVGTIFNGLVQISKHSYQVKHYRNNPADHMSISENNIISLFIDKSNTLWAGTFSNGINHFHLPSLKLGLENVSQNSIHCGKNTAFYDTYQDHNKSLWIASEQGLIEFNSTTEICHLYQLPEEISSQQAVYHIHPIDHNTLLLSTQEGTYYFDRQQMKFHDSNINTPKVYTTFTALKSDNQLLIGTHQGLYLHDSKTKKTEKIQTEKPLDEKIKIHSYTRSSRGRWLFASKQGLLMLNDKQKLSLHPANKLLSPNIEVVTVLECSDKKLWIGTYLKGLYLYEPMTNKISNIGQLLNDSGQLTAYSLLEGLDNNIWIGTNQGLYSYNPINKQVSHFTYYDGLQSNSFLINSATKTNNGKLIFGGPKGLNHFNPKNLFSKNKKPLVAITQFTHFNKPIEPGSLVTGKYQIDKPINQLEELVLSHRDYVVGFEFAAMDFADSTRNQFAFRLNGFDDNWNFVDANNRRATFTNLNPGRYTFQVKAANKDKIWNDSPKELNLIVKPAPWLSWWAKSLYILITLAFIYLYIQSRIRRSEQTAKVLKQQVEERTKEVSQQKQTVETLLKRKNELFANVSHEFRTPLTLILGPVEEMLKEHGRNNLNNLNVIKRNAVRLRNLVEQMLQLSHTNQEKNQYENQQALPTIKIIISSFTALAAEKKISLRLTEEKNAHIRTTPDALEIIIGNLLSNAIKYTPNGGSIDVKCITQEKYFYIHVEDSGPGLDETERNLIFNRFTRLDQHRNIQGSGIGLAVALELTELNNGQLTVNSNKGQGSEFILSLPIFKNTLTSQKPNTETIQQQVETTLLEMETQIPEISEKIIDHTQPSVLIIDDHTDMLNHIGSILSKQYQCLTATDGREGVAIALDKIPDVIISDVMMPVMNGFQLSRIIRNDEKTSHIPLILLTALDDKKSRIRGWREHVDSYITKPFDADELKLRVHNVLVIRNILKRKTAALLDSHHPIETVGLPLKDQQFISKLNTTIKKLYQNPLLNRSQLASEMAISERQLHRKTVALIDQSPIDLLRAYRLQKAKELLRQGHQVSMVADRCGFNSISYFSRCFKAQFGMSPKNYK